MSGKIENRLQRCEERLDALEAAVFVNVGARGRAGIKVTRAVALPENDRDFAALVTAAAQSLAAQGRRFGRNKVFISHVKKDLEEQGYDVGDADRFKHRLVQAHRADHLHLNRADLVEVMDARDVKESETEYLNAKFHFVRLPNP